MSYFYGPVPSRRLGLSLGVDLFSSSKKTCSFDCLYCQLGGSDKKVIRRFSCINFTKFKKELRKAAEDNPKIDYITISGSGEPTLHRGLGKIISAIKKITQNKYPVCVITNSSFLYRREVREELREASLIVPSLDAAFSKTFHKINRPHKGVTFEKIIEGLIKLRKEFRGEIWLEIMLAGGINDSKKEAERFREIIKKIKPDKVQLNLPVRPAEADVALPGNARLKEIKKIIAESTEVVLDFHPKIRERHALGDLPRAILKFLRVRPARLKDLKESLTANSNEISKQLRLLLSDKRIKERIYKGSKYFTIND